MSVGFAVGEFELNCCDGACVVAPCASFTDAEAKVSWERRYPDVLLAYYTALAAVACRKDGCSRGHCGSARAFARAAGTSVGVSVGTVGVADSRGGASDGECVGRGLPFVGSGGDKGGSADTTSDSGQDSGFVGDESRVGGSSCEPSDDAVFGRVGGFIRNGGKSVVESETEVVERGKHYERNKKRRMRNKVRAVPDWRKNARPLPVLERSSAVQGVVGHKGLVVAEQEARESLARRRAAENALKEKLAKLKLAELEDEKRCAEIADLKRSRIIQWTNEATAKSQQSLEKCKSIDPSSSASQYEIRQQAKALADAEAMVRSLTKSVQRAYPDDWQEEIEACRPCGTTEYELAEAGGGY